MLWTASKRKKWIPCDANLLIHSDTTNGDTIFTDSSLSGHTITANGGIAHSTANAKFGGSSIYFDGSNDYLQLANHTDFQFVSGDFTIDTWVYWSGQTASYQYIMSKSSGGASDFEFLFGPSGSYTLGCAVRISHTEYAATTNDTISTNTWHHVAMIREGDTLKLHLDGILKASQSLPTGGVVDNNAAEIHIGNVNNSSGNTDYLNNSYLDEIHIVKGQALWTSNFTPPSSPYC